MAPAADSGVSRSERSPVNSTPGATCPLTERSSDCRNAASCAEPNSTAMVLLPVTASAAPAGAAPGSRAVAGRVLAASSGWAAPLSGVPGTRAGRYTWRW